MRRGASVWVHLVVLALVPLLATAGLGAVVIDARLHDVRGHEHAEELLATSAELDEVRRLVDQELVPAVVVAVLRDDRRAASLGFQGPARSQLLQVNRQRQRTARDQTDLALREAHRTPHAAEVLADVEQRLRSVRSAADAVSSGPERLTRRYLEVSDALARAERSAAVRAGGLAVDARTARAVEDVRLVVELTSTASRQLPLLFATVSSTGADRVDLQGALRAAEGGFVRLGSASDALSDGDLRDGVHQAVTYGVSAQLALRLSVPTALVVGSPGALGPQEVLDLVPGSDVRDAALAEVLRQAVREATSASQQARQRSQEQLRAALLLVVAVAVVAVGTTAWVGRDLGRHLARLQVAADAAREGRPVAVPRRAPREVRRVADELARTAHVLQGVHCQIEALARGDLSRALDVPSTPGRLGEAVQASVESMVVTLVANEALRAELAERASTDPLTGLPNRGALLSALHGARARQAAVGGGVAVLFLDLDGFKPVNDTHGHAAGDQLLCKVARRMVSEVREGDVVGRLGGDEFVVVAEDLDTAGARDLAHRLVAALGRPFPLARGSGPDLVLVHVGASVGVAVANGSDAAPLDGAVLLAAADAAVYRAKASGRGCVALAPPPGASAADAPAPPPAGSGGR